VHFLQKVQTLASEPLSKFGNKTTYQMVYPNLV